jgi:hypothetical protein
MLDNNKQEKREQMIYLCEECGEEWPEQDFTIDCETHEVCDTCIVSFN